MAQDPKSKSGSIESMGALISAPNLLCPTDTVWGELQDLSKTHEGADLRAAVAKHLNTVNAQGRDHIKSALRSDPYAASKAIASYAYLTDQLVTLVFRSATELIHPKKKPAKADHIAVIAVGGYGRAEMAPFSDVDLLFLSSKKLSPWSESVVETMLYTLWDMKLKIGHATRTISDCITLAHEDQTISTALLELRPVCGNADLPNELRDRLWLDVFSKTGPEYVEKKLDERDMRHRRQGGQRYMVEPNVKEGKGGLRDLQTLFWITKYLSRAHSSAEMIAQGYLTQPEFERFEEAEYFLWAVRCHLHLIANRATEQLTFDMQVEVAAALGFESSDGMRSVENFMQTYFRHATHVGDLTRIFLTQLEANHVKSQPSLGRKLINAINWGKAKLPDGYEILHGRLAIQDEVTFLKDPINILRLFQEALRSEILIHPDSMRLVTSTLHLITKKVRTDPKAVEIFLSLLLDYGNPERALRRMNELGVLGAFIPEFQRIVAMMQFNMYHHYTVDEHTIQCVSNLSAIEHGDLIESLPVASSILKQGVNRKVLYVAMLLHDIGKGLPEDHSIAGARIAWSITDELGLNTDECDTVIWLIRHHLLMSDVAQKRDLSDPRTVRDFAKTVQSINRLKLLTVLTVCDIRGVGPGTWNNWKAQLLRDLYHATLKTLQDGIVDTSQQEDEAKESLIKALNWPTEKAVQEIDRHYASYWQGLDTDTHVVFANLLDGLDQNEIRTEITQDKDRDATRACFAIADHPGIFSRLAGALALVGANVVDARSYTSSDGYATSVFWIQDREGKPYEKSRLTRLRTMIDKTLKGEVIAKDALRDRDKIKKRERDFRVPTEITFDNLGSEIYTIIEVDTRDRPGLLFDLTRTLSGANIYIASAVIATYGVQAVDVFYVKDMFGMKLHDKSKRERIEKRLRDAISIGAESAMT